MQSQEGLPKAKRSGAERDAMTDKWHLVWDAHRFHVYVMVQREEERLRIDWRQYSALDVGPYTEVEGELVIAVGRKPFCIDCLFEKMNKLLKHYQIFVFNCRTVSYLVLTEVMGFDERAVYKLFADQETLCGLDMSQCFTMAEIDHFRRWKSVPGNTIFGDIEPPPGKKLTKLEQARYTYYTT